MSVSWVDRKLEVTNWAMANVRPTVSVAGRVARTPRHPSMMKTRAIGTNTASSGVCRPTIWDRWCSGSPVTVASVVIGTARAPKATGAVFATSAVSYTHLRAHETVLDLV